MAGQISVSPEGEIATVTISQPGKRNALTVEMWGELKSAFEKAGADATGQIPLTFSHIPRMREEICTFLGIEGETRVYLICQPYARETANNLNSGKPPCRVSAEGLSVAG
jgi:hypothetical protein